MNKPISLPNTDPETGIKYGVIPQNEVLQAWCDDSEEIMPECSCEEEDECYCEPIGYKIDDGEYIAESDDYGDIFIIKSPYYTLCKECSPCAPLAGYIKSQDDLGYKTYCFGIDFFEDNKTDIAIYKVSNDERIN